MGQLVEQKAELGGEALGQEDKLVAKAVQLDHVCHVCVFEALQVLKNICCILHRKFFHRCEFVHDAVEQFSV